MIQGIRSIITPFLGCKVAKKLHLSFPRRRESSKSMNLHAYFSKGATPIPCANFFLGSRLHGNDEEEVGLQKLQAFTGSQ